MKKILVINASAKSLHSQSRKFTEIFTDHWKKLYADPAIRFRELGNTNVPHISQNWLAAAFMQEESRSEDDIEVLKTSDTYISELREADVIVLGSPMYNWSIPSTLKAYIDQIMRMNETFKVDRTKTNNPYVGLLRNKTMYLLLSRGETGYEKGEGNEHMNFQSTYLKTVFNIIGISDIHVIAIEGASTGGEIFKKSIETAHQNLRNLIDSSLI